MKNNISLLKSKLGLPVGNSQFVSIKGGQKIIGDAGVDFGVNADSCTNSKDCTESSNKKICSNLNICRSL